MAVDCWRFFMMYWRGVIDEAVLRTSQKTVSSMSTRTGRCNGLSSISSTETTSKKTISSWLCLTYLVINKIILILSWLALVHRLGLLWFYSFDLFRYVISCATQSVSYITVYSTWFLLRNRTISPFLNIWTFLVDLCVTWLWRNVIRVFIVGEKNTIQCIAYGKVR